MIDFERTEATTQSIPPHVLMGGQRRPPEPPPIEVGEKRFSSGAAILTAYAVEGQRVLWTCSSGKGWFSAYRWRTCALLSRPHPNKLSHAS